MIKVHSRLHVGDQADYEDRVKDTATGKPNDGWAVVHCAKDPYHRRALGYSGRGADRDHPEYLVAIRGREIMLNMVDVPDPSYIAPQMIDQAMAFIDQNLRAGRDVLCHCNQGGSRGPTVAMLYMAGELPQSFAEAEHAFQALYPNFAPAAGCRGYAEQHWARYRDR